MVNSDYKYLRGVTSIGDTLLMNELENNLKTYLDWGLANVGGFVNVRIPTSGSFGGNFHQLKAASDPAYTAGQVWESIRKDWVWESGVQFSGVGGSIVTPIAISGVYINGQFYGPGHATYGHYYDYPNGRVIFNNALSTSSGVSLEYSYRWAQTHVADNAPWFYEGSYQSLRPDDAQWASSYPYSGDFSVSPQHRIQFPAVIIEAVPRADSEPYELGNLSMWVYQDIIFNIVADTRWARNKLIDVLRMEYNHNLWLYDTDLVVASGKAPLDMRGMLVNSGVNYPYLVDTFRFTRCYFQKVQLADVESINPKLYEAKVRITMELGVNQL